MNWLEFSHYENSNSKFNAELSTKGGYITFSNSGKGGNRKFFTLSLESFLICLKDILANHSSFLGHEKYIEKEWRDLGSRYYSDDVANAQCTVQTKPMFVTLSKIIIWANSPNLDSIDPEQLINLDKDALQIAITKLTSLSSEFAPEAKNSPVDTSPSEERNEFIDQFADWLISKNGTTHNYLKDSFSSSKSKLIDALKKYETEYENDFGEKVFSFATENIDQFISHLETNLYSEDGTFFEFSSKVSNHMPRAILGKNNYIKFLKEKSKLKTTILNSPFNILEFEICCSDAGLKYSTQLITRYISSLATKPFVLLSGLSGSGKTKLALSFAQWICESEGQYCIVPIGADWINREPLLGYVNALNAKEYVLPENKALELLIKANKDETKPYFLILDEMNLSHVERYFADFLSVMESNDNFKLHSDRNNEKSGVPHEFAWPKNLFVVGTVNIDETTYMFSPKVLDRANVIEFRVDKTDIESFLKERKEITSIAKLGAGMGNSFVEIAKDYSNNNNFTQLNSELIIFFKELQNLGAEFGYRTASEIQTLFSKIDLVNPSYSTKENEKIDIAIMQKLLPKLHGSRRKLLKTLNILAQKCLEQEQIIIFDERGVPKIEDDNEIKYILSFEKIGRMYKNAIENGFASYAEA